MANAALRRGNRRNVTHNNIVSYEILYIMFAFHHVREQGEGERPRNKRGI